MPFQDRIIAYINEHLKSGSLSASSFLTARYFGNTTILARKKGDQLEVMPAVEQAGEFKLVEPDDRYAMTVYHKIGSNTYGTVPKSRGDGYDYKCTTEITLVCCADSRKVKMQSEVLESLFVFGIPQRISGALLLETGLINCLITPLASDIDKLRVFRQEYPQSEYFLKPFHQLFLLRYRIETTFNKACIDACLCGA
jgi:hypothetical protein